jgi:hypothetical protein
MGARRALDDEQVGRTFNALRSQQEESLREAEWERLTGARSAWLKMAQPNTFALEDGVEGSASTKTAWLVRSTVSPGWPKLIRTGLM